MARSVICVNAGLTSTWLEVTAAVNVIRLTWTLLLMTAPIAAPLQAGIAQPRSVQPRSPQPHAAALRVVLIAGNRSDNRVASAVRGAQMGAEEARHTAQMMDLQYDFTVLYLTIPLASANLRTIDSAQIIISTLAANDLQILRDRSPHHLILDLTPVPPQTSCDALVLHLSAPSSALTNATLWHPALERFGGEQLNQRYRRSTGAPMDDAAWLGWFATKVAVEAAMRAHTTDVDALARFIRSPRARFDGQKGRPLVFDARNGVLIQPLYKISAAGAPPESTQPVVSPQCRPRAP